MDRSVLPYNREVKFFSSRDGCVADLTDPKTDINSKPSPKSGLRLDQRIRWRIQKGPICITEILSVLRDRTIIQQEMENAFLQCAEFHGPLYYFLLSLSAVV